jgi:hypothetical protein
LPSHHRRATAAIPKRSIMVLRPHPNMWAGMGRM